jgi:stage II sporulation SpoE-like protein/GAF domain-containing protein/PAS domain-containing protein
LAEAHITPDDEPALPRRREPDLTGLATFILDPTGRVTSWPTTATSLFGCQPGAVTGRDVRDVLLTGPGHRALADHALARAAAGEVWTTTVAGGFLGEGSFALRWEAVGTDGAVLVIAQRTWPQPVPGWLNAATAQIGGSLDLRQTAAEAASAAVPRFADAAIIYGAERLLAADDSALPRAGHGTAVRRLAARLAHESEAVTSSLLPPGEVLFLNPGTPRAQAMAAGKPILSDHLHGETPRIAAHPRGREITARYASFLAVPLIAGNLTVGCALFARTAASPAFSPADITLADELACRTAVCIDNARLYDRERRTALALQRGLLPGQPSIPPGIEVAHRYLPVGGNVVGGDWHDIIPLPGGRAALIVGDAMGHGPEAAAVMVQLRTAAHTLAELDMPPHQVLGRLDAMAARMDATASPAAAPFATCVYAVINPASGTAEIARAGHLPPILVPPGEPAQVLDLPAGLPLGLGTGPGSFQAVCFTLPVGATLALYTDGLVESRTRSIDDGLAALQRALSTTLTTPGRTADSACHSVIRTLREHGEDDITVMLARILENNERP